MYWPPSASYLSEVTQTFVEDVPETETNGVSSPSVDRKVREGLERICGSRGSRHGDLPLDGA
jgi:hypothetical protein